MTKWIYSFGKTGADGRTDMKNLLGGKGANLAEMSSLGLPVPPGFTITTEACTYFYKNNKSYPETLAEELNQALAKIEKEQGRGFGDKDVPLLLSVRSGARVSMPGMMDTVLNLGLNDETVKGLAEKAGDERFAWDSYRRFIQMYGNVVLGLPHHRFEEILEDIKRDEDIHLDTDVTAQMWKTVVAEYKDFVQEELGKPFPDDPQEQLWGAIGAVFGSWDTPRAVSYREIHHIPNDWGTAVNVQAMVFGNMGDDCATGVAFTRDPSTGANYFYGEFLVNAQGEDVVAGIRTPQPLSIESRKRDGSTLPALEEVMPSIYKELEDIRHKLEKHYRDVQDVEFTVQEGTLYMLQTRTGKRTTGAALKIAVDMVAEGLIDEREALLRIEPESLDQILHPTLDPSAHKIVLAKGLPASPGAVSGKIVFSADEAEALGKKGEQVILCRHETSPEDIHGMHAAVGILTTRGGMTSHAAVVARGMGRPCIAGAGTIRIDYKTGEMHCGNKVLKAGELITIDGGVGDVMEGVVPTVQPALSGDFETLMQWADAERRMAVRANAETPDDAKTSKDFGAAGIGLCRTEHMFFDPERIQNVREMILADDVAARKEALQKLLPEQRGDFEKIFEIMEDLPVTIRLLDPPLHEFLPHSDEDIRKFSSTGGFDEALVRRRLAELHESNPMLGHRGCRLAVTSPEIYEMQVQAILEAALAVKSRSGHAVTPEIMIPLVGTVKEFTQMKALVERVAAEVFAAKGQKVSYLIGTMIELPRAALVADQIAEHADFFSFGTNDLTQTTLGLSRDDAGSFIGSYIQQGIFARDPFASIDVEGVGALVAMGTAKGRAEKSSLKVGVCGEHGGDPLSIDFFEATGLDYVSCSPYRIPVARLAAARASISRAIEKNQTKSEKAAA